MVMMVSQVLLVQQVQLGTVDLQVPVATEDSKACLVKLENQVSLARMVKLVCLDSQE